MIVGSSVPPAARDLLLRRLRFQANDDQWVYVNHFGPAEGLRVHQRFKTFSQSFKGVLGFEGNDIRNDSSNTLPRKKRSPLQFF